MSYSIDGIEYRDYDGKPLVKVSKDGPYLVSGGIELVGEVEFLMIYQKNIIHFVDVELQIINLFVMGVILT